MFRPKHTASHNKRFYNNSICTCTSLPRPGTLILGDGRDVALISSLLWNMPNANSSSKNPAKLCLQCGRQPEGPNCRLWSTTRLKLSAPSSRSTLSGVPNPGLASFKPSRCFHLVFGETGHRGRLDVFIDSISASTCTIFPLMSRRVILKLVGRCEEGWFDIAPIALNFTLMVTMH